MANYVDAQGLPVTRVDVFYQDANGNMVPVTANNPLPIVGGVGGAGGTAANPAYFRLEDGTTSALATLAQFHSADNVALGSGYGLNTGAIPQLLNSSGNLDRQRGVAADTVPSQGVAASGKMLSWPVTCGPVTSGAITGSGAAQTITLTAVSGTTRGIAWALQVGQTLVLNAGLSDQDDFVITAINTGSKTVTGVIQNSHSASATATAFFYDQARSAMVPDGSRGAGFEASGTYLYNPTLNSSNGGWEGARSAISLPTNGTGVLVVGTGLSPVVSLSAVSATGAGTALDGGVCHSNHTLVVTTSAGVTAGAVQLQGSMDGVSWLNMGSAVSTTAANSIYYLALANQPMRLIRANVTTTITGGTITATVGTAG